LRQRSLSKLIIEKREVFLGLDCKDPLPVRLVGQINVTDFVRAPDDDEFDSVKVLVTIQYPVLALWTS